MELALLEVARESALAYGRANPGFVWYLGLPAAAGCFGVVSWLTWRWRGGSYTPESLLANNFGDPWMFRAVPLRKWGWGRLGYMRALVPVFAIGGVSMVLGWLGAGSAHVWGMSQGWQDFWDLAFAGMLLVGWFIVPVLSVLFNWPRFWMPREFREQPGMLAGWRRGVSAQDVARGRYWPGEPFRWRHPDEDVSTADELGAGD